MPSTTVATLPWVVALNPGVTVATARVELVGTLQDVLKYAGRDLQGAQPADRRAEARLHRRGRTGDGTAPLDVTYRFALTNQGVPPDPLSSVTLAHPYCAPVYESGDTDADDAIDAAETWRYACTYRFATPGDFTSTSNAVAISASDGRGVTPPRSTRSCGPRGRALGR